MYDRNIFRSSSVVLGNLRQSSVILGKCSENVRKCSSGLQNNFGKSSEIFGKWSGIFRKSSKTLSLVCLYNKQNITCLLVDMNFIFSCSTQYLTCSLRSLVRYRVERLEIKSVSTRGHAISSITEIVIYRYLFFLYQLWSALNLKHNLSYHCLGYVKVILFPVICGESQMCS